MVVVASDAIDGGTAADRVDQAAQAAILGDGEIPLEGICGGRTGPADQANVDDAAIVAFDPGADLSLGAAEKGGPVPVN